MHRLLLDTNVLLDSIIANRPQHAEAVKLLQWCNGSGDVALVAPTSLNDSYYILCKAYDEPTAREAVRKLMGLVVIAPVGVEECDMSMRSNEPDFEDGLVRACAELNGADYIVTRDSAAFAGTPVKSVTPDEFLRVADHEDKELLEQILRG